MAPAMSSQVEAVELPMESKTNKRRGFCFVTFRDEETVKQVMEKKYHNIGLSKVHRLVLLPGLVTSWSF